MGRPAKQNGFWKRIKGVLAKLRGVLESCGTAFSKMARGADKLMEKAQRGKEPEEQKQSVKSELRQLKTEHSEKPKCPFQGTGAVKQEGYIHEKKIDDCGGGVLRRPLLFSGIMLFREYHDQKQSAEAFEQVAALVVEDSAPEEPENAEAAEPEMTAFEKYAEVFAQNDDLIGWISIPGTRIDYPVMQTKDDPDFYLKHAFDKSYSNYGVPLRGGKLRRGYFRQYGALRTSHEQWQYVFRPVQICGRGFLPGA